METSTATTEIIKRKLIEEICQNKAVSSQYKDDLIQEVYYILLTYNQSKIEEIYNKGDIKFFLTRIINNQYDSHTSPFFTQYKKYDINKTTYTIEEDEED